MSEYKTDAAGNFFFEVNNHNYKIFPIDWRRKRQLRGKMAKAFIADGDMENATLDPFSDSFYELQDYVLGMVDYLSDSGPIRLDSPAKIEEHFKAIGMDEVEGVDIVFGKAFEYLSANFTKPAQEQSNQVNSNQGAGHSSEKTNIQSMLSETLKK